MGLDMYAYTTTEKLAGAVDFPQPKELHYWRKHYRLHEWMERLYVDKGGVAEDFSSMSCVTLDRADLDRLEVAILASDLPDSAVADFFFGEYDGSEREDDLAFIAKARKALESGKTVFYVANW